MPTTPSQPRATPQCRPPRGFTLIELLVVIAIIAILAAILFPVFSRARENARKASCMNNLKQIVLAATQYTQDYDELCVPIRIGGAGSTGFSWVTCVTPYLKNVQVLRCPSQAATKKITYTYNFNLGQGGGKALADIPLVAQTPMFMDAYGTTDPLQAPTVVMPSGTATSVTSGSSGGSVGYGNLGRILANSANPSAASYNDDPAGAIMGDRHMDGSNYSFVDGHCKWLHYETDGSLATFTNSVTNTPYSNGPHHTGLDYDCDGVVGAPGTTPNSGTSPPGPAVGVD